MVKCPPPIWALVLAGVCGLASIAAQEPSAVVDPADEDREVEQKRIVGELMDRLRRSGKMDEKGSMRILVVPVPLDANGRPVVVSESDAVPPPEAEKPPPKPFIPATMVEGPLTAAADVAYELRRLKEEIGEVKSASARAPSSKLVEVLQENERQIELAALEERKRGLEERERLAEMRERERAAAALARLGEPGAVPAGEARRGLLVAMLPGEIPGSPSVGRGDDGPVEQLARTGESFEFSAVSSPQAPFHAFDFDPSETFIVEIEAGEVARVRGQGNEWSWLQLQSGLMGVVRNQHLRIASRSEVMRFLLEEGGGPEATMPLGHFDIRIVDLNDPEFPLGQSEAGTMGPVDAAPGLVNPEGVERPGAAGGEGANGGEMEMEGAAP